jgi:predicted nucleotidyltransferase
MALDTETLNNIIHSYVVDVKNIFQIDHVFLFGSYAKGIANRDSDIDLCFFSNEFENIHSFDVGFQLFKLARKYIDYPIEPHSFPTSELQNDNPMVKEIMRTGVELQI